MQIMAHPRPSIGVYSVILLAIAFLCFAFASAEDASKSKDHSAEKDTSLSDDSNQDDSKEKRSREEILFGNQQNKPSGLVDDLMGMSEGEDDAEDESNKDGEGKNDNISQNQQNEPSSDEHNGKQQNHPDNSNDMMMMSGTDNWYNTMPMSPSALQYLSNPSALHTLPPTDYANSLYDQEDLYRRKRQLLGHPLPLRKRRSLRSSLGQMIQKRGIRMPRRSMRLKRQVDMGDLLNLLENERYYEDQPQVSTKKMNGWGNKMDKKHVSGHFGAYPETPAPEFRYPYTFRHRDGGILTAANDFDDNKEDNLDLENLDDIDSLMLLHPNARYVETPENLFPYRSRDEESEAFQKWLARHTTPNVFTVSRRSSPTFYPMDYRYIPGYKKRNIFSNGNRMSNNYNGENDDSDGDLGKWGHVVQVPEAYASADDVARLYGLANLMAEGEDEAKMRRAI